MVLDSGGDDITQFLHTLLTRTSLPYRDADLSRWYDFKIFEELKERMVVLSEVCLNRMAGLNGADPTLSQADVGLNLYDFYVRVPGKPTRKYKMRIYDDVILAPYVSSRRFCPRAIELISIFAGSVRTSCHRLR